jgi:hypothetical protein
MKDEDSPKNNEHLLSPLAGIAASVAIGAAAVAIGVLILLNVIPRSIPPAVLLILGGSIFIVVPLFRGFVSGRY